MRWFRSLLYYRILKGLEFRLEKLGELARTADTELNVICEQLERLELEEPRPVKSIELLRDELLTWNRIASETSIRRDEVEGTLGLVLKDWNRR